MPALVTIVHYYHVGSMMYIIECNHFRFPPLRSEVAEHPQCAYIPYTIKIPNFPDEHAHPECYSGAYFMGLFFTVN